MISAMTIDEITAWNPAPSSRPGIAVSAIAGRCFGVIVHRPITQEFPGGKMSRQVWAYPKQAVWNRIGCGPIAQEQVTFASESPVLEGFYRCGIEATEDKICAPGS
jgi:hypothetical protein